MEDAKINRNQMTDSMVNLAAALALVDGDQELLAELVNVFLQEFPSQMAAVRGAVERRDSKGLRSAAHLLKGSLSTFGTNPAFQLAARLETYGMDEDIAGAVAELSNFERTAEALRDGLL